MATASVLSISVSVAKNKLIPYEPLSLSITISNGTDKSLSVPENCQDMIRIQIRELGKKEWSAIQKWWKPALSHPPLPPIALKPGDKQVVSFMIYTFNSDYELLFKPGQTYSVRACIYSSKPPIDAASPIIEIEGLNIPTNEQSPYTEMVTNKSLIRFLAPIQHGGDVSVSAADVKRFLDHFPDSCYSQYLRLSFIANLDRPDFSNNLETADKYRAYLNTNSSWMIKYIK
jgi:hypothetical protein